MAVFIQVLFTLLFDVLLFLSSNWFTNIPSNEFYFPSACQPVCHFNVTLFEILLISVTIAIANKSLSNYNIKRKSVYVSAHPSTTIIDSSS